MNGEIPSIQNIVTILEHDPGWTAQFETEAERIRTIIAPSRCFIDHVGSSAVPGLAGKPVIDILVSLRDWSQIDRAVASLANIGYAERERVALDNPRVFMIKQGIASGVASFNLHIVPPDSAWGRRMIVFRDELSADRELAKRYAALKRQLAAAHPNDLEAYTRGKAEFVGKALRNAAGAFGTDRLLTHQRVELDRSQVLQVVVIGAQFALAVLAATSVFFTDNTTLLKFAVGGFALVALWLWLGRIQRQHRAAGDRARRVVMVASGLGQRVSAEQRLRIFDSFSVPIIDRPLVREESYFASRSDPGYLRLAELIEESAYWTRDLQHTSAKVLHTLLAVVGLVIGLILWRSISTLPTNAQVSLARVLIAVLVFLLSSDVIGTMLAYQEAANTIGEILHRVESAAARGYTQSDTLLLMSDYNAAVESAPVPLPGVFRLRRSRLTRKWRVNAG